MAFKPMRILEVEIGAAATGIVPSEPAPARYTSGH